MPVIVFLAHDRHVVGTGADNIVWTEITPETDWDWQAGYLIFRNDANDIGGNVARSFNLRWVWGEILRGPRVVLADPLGGVIEEMLWNMSSGCQQMNMRFAE